MSILYSVNSLQDIMGLEYCENSKHALENFFKRAQEDELFFCELGKIFIQAVKKNNLDVEKLIIECSRFSKIPVGNNGLGKAVEVAGMYGKNEALQLLKSCNRINEIPDKWLNDTLIFTESEECKEIIKEIIKNRSWCPIL